MGALSLTASKAAYHAGFGPLLPGIYHAPFGHVHDLDWFEEVLFDKVIPATEVAAIIVEPIQGEGGYVLPEDGFLPGLRELCDRHGILLIADEIQTGAGRTGAMWAVEHWGVEPDILLSAKGIASGMPLSAVVARASLMESWGRGAHGSTYGGNPVACAAALATLGLLEDGLIENAAARGAQGLTAMARMRERFSDVVEASRGKGLMLALKLATLEPPRPSSGRRSGAACSCSGPVGRPSACPPHWSSTRAPWPVAWPSSQRPWRPWPGWPPRARPCRPRITDGRSGRRWERGSRQQARGRRG